MSGARFNLPFTLGIGDVVPSNIPPEIRPAFVEVYSAFQQVQSVFHNYLGIGQQLKDSWAALPIVETLHKASQWRSYTVSGINEWNYWINSRNTLFFKYY